MHFTDRFPSFWGQVDIRGEDECWLWKGAKSPKEYGRYRRGLFGTERANRIAWILANGDHPGDLLVCHHCDTPACCNPAHLFLGTHKDNSQDAVQKGRLTGSLGCKWYLSDATRAKQSLAFKGKPKSKEHRAKLSAAKKGKKLSDDHRANIASAQIGKKRSPETKAKMSAAQKLRWERYRQQKEAQS